LFTRDFRKCRIAFAAVGIAGLLYGGINIGLVTLSRWIEARAEVYPYKDEDWLRYLLGPLFKDRGHNRIMLVGESAVRENLLYEEFNKAFPTMNTFQGGLSLGTIDDLLISLDYIKRVYGRGALPQVLVVGISPRFVANIPEKRPFRRGLDLYSPYYRVEETRAGSRLKAKTQWEGFFSRLRFFTLKQQKRYLGALAVLVRQYLIGAAEPNRKAGPAPKLLGALLHEPVGTIKQIWQSALGDFVRRWASPYKYHHLRPAPVSGLRSWLRWPDSWWRQVHGWVPDADENMLADQFKRLRELAEGERIALYVINLPENVESRKLYKAENYRRYLELVRKDIGNAPFLDLHEMLGPEEFYDIVHATVPGAKRVTETVIRFIKSHGSSSPQLASTTCPSVPEICR
jgi:hypothetical protein